MTIGKKLYMNFGAILAMVLVLFLINLVAVQREHSAKAAASQALGLADATDKVKFQIMQNRLYLSNYLLSGDTREVDRISPPWATAARASSTVPMLAATSMRCPSVVAAGALAAARSP